MTSSDPTARPEWDTVQKLPEQVLDDPSIPAGGPRGVQPWQVTPGAPPVQGTVSPKGRTLLQDATIRRRLLKKASATPVPAPRVRAHEPCEAVKPAHHEGEFFKPAHPLLTNVVVDRPPSVHKSDQMETATQEEVAPAPTRTPPPVVHARTTPLPVPRVEDLDDAWFLDPNGTIEPAAQRGIFPSGRIAGWIVAGAALTALAVVGVAVVHGPISRATATHVVPPPLPPVTHVASAPPTPSAASAAAGSTAPVAPAPVAAPVAAPAKAAAESAPIVKPAAVPPPAASGQASAGVSSLDSLRTAMAANPILAPDHPAQPANPSGPVEKKLWSHIEHHEAAPQPLWTSLQDGTGK